MSALTIGRVESPGDFDMFRDLVVEYEESLDPDLRHSDFAEQLADLQRSYSAPHAALLAIAAGTAAGCIGLRKLDDDDAVVKKLYVRPAFRHAGAGRALVAAIIRTARNAGFSRLVLDTDRMRLAAAYRLYLSFGFEECAPYGNVDYACPTFMQLSLRPASVS